MQNRTISSQSQITSLLIIIANVNLIIDIFSISWWKIKLWIICISFYDFPIIYNIKFQLSLKLTFKLLTQINIAHVSNRSVNHLREKFVNYAERIISHYRAWNEVYLKKISYNQEIILC